MERTCCAQWRIQHFQKGANTRGGRANLLFCKCFAENSTKMKEFGLRMGPSSLAPPGSATSVPGRMWGKLTTRFLQLRIKDFPYRLRGGAGCQAMSLGQNLLLGKIFAKNCVKMIDIGLRASPASPWIRYCFVFLKE